MTHRAGPSRRAARNGSLATTRTMTTASTAQPMDSHHRRQMNGTTPTRRTTRYFAHNGIRWAALLPGR